MVGFSPLFLFGVLLRFWVLVVFLENSVGVGIISLTSVEGYGLIRLC